MIARWSCCYLIVSLTLQFSTIPFNFGLLQGKVVQILEGDAPLLVQLFHIFFSLRSVILIVFHIC